MSKRWMDISDAARRLRAGGIVAIPTETVYGLAGDAFNPSALAKIFQAKGRPVFDPLILHIASFDSLEKIAKSIPEKALTLAQKFWPGPLTLVLPKRDNVPDLATSALPTVAIRFPSHPIARQIIREADTPLAAPSANLFKHISPTTALHVEEQLKGKIDGIVDGGACEVGVESTILSFSNAIPTLLRPGAITLEMIQESIGEVVQKKSSSSPGRAMEAPGLMDSHYKPSVPLFYGKVEDFETLPENTVRIAFGNQPGKIPPTLNLSLKENLVEATANLYAHMHALDCKENSLILVDPIPLTGLGLALNDRLCRASLKSLTELPKK